LIKENIKNCYNSNKKFVLADSSFYICFLEELKRYDCYDFFSYYDFCIGDKVLNELNSKKLLLDKPITHVDFENHEYYKLFSPFLSNLEKNKDKGEFEIIALALLFYKKNILKYIIVDDKGAKKIINKNFRELSDYNKGSIGLIKSSYLDGFIDNEKALSILSDICKLIETFNYDENKKYPCSLSKNSYKKVIKPVWDFLNRGV